MGRRFCPNVAEGNGETVRIHLAGGRVAVVDQRYYETIRHFRWHSTGGRSGLAYVRTALGAHRGLKLHSLVMFLSGAGTWETVDHRNGDTLDNRRSNLRIATKVQNGRNRRTDGFKGVSVSGDKWRAKIGQRHLGLFPTREAAARAYDAAAEVLFGEFARLNFPVEAQCR